MKPLNQFLLEMTRLSVQNIGKRLKDAGYHELGSGHFAHAFGKEGRSHVVKIFRDKDISDINPGAHRSEPDYAYPRYLELVKNRSNPHFPQIKGGPVKLNSHYSGVQIEKLGRLSYANEKLARKVDDYAKDYQSLHKLENTKLQHIKGNMPWEFPSSIQGDIDEHRKRTSHFEEKHSDLAKAVQLIHHHVIKKIPGSFFDLHPGNFLQRPNGELVITDPVSYGVNVKAPTIPHHKPKQLELIPHEKSPSSSTEDNDDDRDYQETTRRWNPPSDKQKKLNLIIKNRQGDLVRLR